MDTHICSGRPSHPTDERRERPDGTKHWLRKKSKAHEEDEPMNNTAQSQPETKKKS